jgi:hypothetical protein
MKSRISIIMIAVLPGLMAGCGATAGMIDAKSQSERTDVFTEVTEAGSPPRGFADMIVQATIKTHEAGYYIVEADKSLHGRPGYPFVFNIDGQAAVWKAGGEKEVAPAYDKQGGTSRHPEAGTGIKYRLEKRLRLRPGTHTVALGLPEEEYYVKAEITLRDGEEAALEFRPIYRYKTRPTRIQTFLAGVSRYEVYLNGVEAR